MTDTITFDDGAAYERYMGAWSRLAGDEFLRWLDPLPALHWLDVGCGNGAFTERLAERCAPASVHGIDPSAQQLAFARTRPALRGAHFQLGDAMALPYEQGSFDAAVMPLVIFFVPDPARGVAEMHRVLRAGGVASAYAWDMPGGGFPYAALHAVLREHGAGLPAPPSPDASRVDALRDLWTDAGFVGVETREITVQRTFDSFDEYWSTLLGGASVARVLASMPAGSLARVQDALRVRYPADADGRITYTARANAVQGRRPA